MSILASQGESSVLIVDRQPLAAIGDGDAVPITQDGDVRRRGQFPVVRGLQRDIISQGDGVGIGSCIDRCQRPHKVSRITY